MTIIIALLILKMTELFKKQHDGFWTLNLGSIHCDLGLNPL